MDPSPAALRHVRDLARAALAAEAGRSTPAPADVEGARIALEETLFAITRHRLVNVLCAHGADIGLDPDLTATLEAVRVGQRHLLLAQQLELGDIQGAVSAAGVRCLVIKGLPLAVQTTGDPGARGSGDIDLLVPPADVATVHRVLCARGWSLREDGQFSPGTWAWKHVLRNTNALTYVGPGSNIDLHWRLDTTLDSLPDFDTLWSRRSEVTLGGVGIPTLSPGDALGQSAFHAAKDRWRWLRSLVDLHRLAGLEESWSVLGVAREPHRLEILTLAVTRASLGLPDGVSADVLARIDRVPRRTVARALADQELPALKTSRTPGLESARNLRYLIRASSTPRDLRRSFVATTLPVKVVSGIDSRTAWTGLPVAGWHRLVRLRRRTSDWARREPVGTGADERVRTP